MTKCEMEMIKATVEDRAMRKKKQLKIKRLVKKANAKRKKSQKDFTKMFDKLNRL